jgi:hypothetical protein
MYFVSIRCDTACSGGTITANFPTFKFNIDPADDKTGLRGWDCCVQLAEIALFDGAGTAIPGSAASNTVGLEPLIAGDYCDDFGNPQNPGQHPCGELPFDAVDGNIKNSNTGNTNHKWLDFTRGDLVISFSSSVSVASYDWRTANDAPNRDPVKWVLEGSHGSDVWVAVDDTYASAMFNPTEERFKWQGPFPIKNGGGLSYGWDCQGNATVDYSGGRRGLDRDNGLGINHFDRDGTCPGKVNWQIAVPNGAYTVTVDFGEDAWTHGCEVEGSIVCPESEGSVHDGVNDGCIFKNTVWVTDGYFTISGSGWTAPEDGSTAQGTCHSVSMVKLTTASDVDTEGNGAGLGFTPTSASSDIIGDVNLAAGLSRTGCVWDPCRDVENCETVPEQPTGLNVGYGRSPHAEGGCRTCTCIPCTAEVCRGFDTAGGAACTAEDTMPMNGVRRCGSASQSTIGAP